MLPNVLLPSATDHVPALAEEVRSALAVEPGQTVVDATFGSGGHAELLVADLDGRGRFVAVDRDPSVRPYFERFARRHGRLQTRFLRGQASIVLAQLAANGVRADAILLDLGVSSMQIDRPERGFSYAVDAPLDMRMDSTADALRTRARERVERARSRADLPPLRRGALREADRARDRPAPPGAAVRADRRPRGDDQGCDPRSGAVRRRPPGEAGVPGAAHRRQRRARRAWRTPFRPRWRCSGPGGRLAVISFHSLEDRVVKTFLREQERGCDCPPDFPICVCGKEPALRAICAEADSTDAARGRPESPRRLRATPGGGQGLMAASAPSIPRAETAPRSRPRPRPNPRDRPAARRRPAPRTALLGSVLWIVGLAAMLAGVVALNVAVLQLNLDADRLARERADLRDRNASLQAELSRAAANMRLEALAKTQLGLVLAEPEQRTDVVLEPVSRRPVDRRIRLLLVVLLLAFAASLGRAVWLQAVRAAPLAELAQRQHRQSVEVPARRGTIYDRGGVELALGERATDRLRGSTTGSRPAARGGRGRAHPRRRLGRARAPTWPTARSSFVYIQRKADPTRAARLLRLGLDGRRLLPRGAAALPAGVDRRARARLRGGRQHGARRARERLDPVLRGTPGKRTFVQDPIGRALDVVSTQPERDGRDVFLTIDHTLQAQAPGGARRRRRGAGGRRRRPRSCSTRGRATCWRWPWRRRSTRTRFGRRPASRTAQPRGHRHVRARLDASSSSRSPARSPRASYRPQTPFMLAPYDPGRRPRHPRGARAADRDDDRRRDHVPVSRTSARSRSRACSGRGGCRSGSARFGFGRLDRDRVPGRDAGDRAAARAVVGLDDRQRSRSATASPSRPCRWRRRTRRSRTAASGCSPTSSTASSAAAQPVPVEAPDRLAPGRATWSWRCSKASSTSGTGTGTRPRSPATTSPARRARRRSRIRAAATPTRSYVASFVGISRPATRGWSSSSTVDEPRGAIWGGVVAAPAFQRDRAVRRPASRRSPPDAAGRRRHVAVDWPPR